MEGVVVCDETLQRVLYLLKARHAYTEMKDMLFHAYMLRCMQLRSIVQYTNFATRNRTCTLKLLPIVDNTVMETVLLNARDKALPMHHQYALETLVKDAVDKYKTTHMQVFVKMPKGNTETLLVLPTQTVWDVKVALYRKCADTIVMQPQEMRFLFRGQSMDDFYTMDARGVEDCSTLHLVSRVCGD